MLRKTATVVIAAALGTGTAIGIAACGEDREGDVTFENGGGTETSGTGTETGAATGTTGTETTPTETSP
jgi:hypothetical protein